jgi:hypothetical protein
MAPGRIHRAFDALFGRAGSEPATEAVEDVEAAAASAPAEAPEPEPEPEPTVDERGARAILASAQPPLPPQPRAAAPRTPPPSAEPEPEPAAAGPPREWNLWDLQRAVRDAPGDEQREEWSALLIHLREFANADGDLPAEFDTLVRESFGRVLDEPEAAAAP